MSRFFAAASDSESETSSSDDEIQQRPGVAVKAFQFSDDEEETKRVVRTLKDKRFEELRNIIKTMKNHKKIKDMSNVLTDFETFTKAYDKAKKVVEKEGVPRFYIRTLVELEEFINECWEDREGRKAMSKNNAKGLTTLRQKLRKYSRDFENDIAKYKENPDQGDEESEEEAAASGSDEDDGPTGADFLKKAPAAPAAEVKAKDDESDSDDSMWDDSDDDLSSSSDDGDYGENIAAKFLKRTGDGDSKKKEKVKKEKKVKSRKTIEEEEEEQGWKQVQKGVPATMEKTKMFSKDTEVNHEAVCKKLIEITAARGKKGTDRSDQISLVLELREIAKTNNLGLAIDCKLLFNVIASIFDYNPNIATCMKSEMWESCLNYIKELLDNLVSSSDIVAGEHVAEDSESFGGEPPFRIRGCILTVVERMDEEFTKMLQACDAHSTEYVDRLRDEQQVCELIETLQNYLENRATTEEICRVYLKRITHIYYKFDHFEKPREDKVSSKDMMEKLTKFIYTKDNTDRIRTRAILCHIYHHALHDRWFEARDLMLMSHLQDDIHRSDVPTQIMYNRGMVQLGLCAFRQGMVRDAHNCLVDIQSGGRAKELLAQGLLLQRQHERTPEQEKIEKRRQMPYHMHINLELLECVYLVSAMLLEIPYMAAHEFDARRRMISKNFHHVLRVSERQPLVGPPESMREHVVAASKAMKHGNWKACKNYIINDKMNAKVWDLFYEQDRVRKMINEKIQEESLRTYLFTYSSVYDSLSLTTLAEMFELERQMVHSIMSKMIINEELMASLDEPTQTVVMHRTEPTRLQSLALQLSEKVSSLVENNEKIMEMKLVGGGWFFQKQNQNQGYQGRDNNQEGRQYRDNYQKGGNRDNRGRGGYRGRRGGGGRGRGGGDRDNHNRYHNNRSDRYQHDNY